MLGDSGEDMNSELIGERHIRRYELHARLHQGCNKGEISGEPIEFGDH